jgi:uncharacterized protein YqgC (DUF456 family)
LIPEIIGAVFFILLSLIALALSFFGISGTWVVAAAAMLYNTITWSWAISPIWLMILLIMCIAGELLELTLGAVTARRYGASRTAITASIIGGIIGAAIGIPGTLFGSILGMLIGSFLGAVTAELMLKKNILTALRTGTAAFIGGLGGKLGKFLITIAMIVIVAVIVF